MAKNSQTLGIIPARFASTRFPGKPLVDIKGKTMVRRVYEQAVACPALDAVVVATDDERIFSHVKTFGRVVMTADFHTTGTDRCAEVAALPEFAGFQWIVNIQGDEPFIEPGQIAQVVALLQKKENAQIATLAKRIERLEELKNPNVVKAVFGQNGAALYFSRSPIPHLRGLRENAWVEQVDFYKHIGLYGFQRATLLQIAHLPKGKLETAESLEQLRWLEAGIPIQVGITEFESRGIDTPEDLLKTEQ